MELIARERSLRFESREGCNLLARLFIQGRKRLETLFVFYFCRMLTRVVCVWYEALRETHPRNPSAGPGACLRQNPKVFSLVV